MKKSNLIFILMLSIFVTSAFSGGIENKTNMSTGYLRNPSRNTESKRPEAAFYNIAGTGFMDDGVYFEAGNQFVFKEYKNEISTETFSNINTVIAQANVHYSQTIPSVKGLSSNDETFVWLYPNADVVLKKGSFAAFINFGIYAGGGNLEYSEGTTATHLAFVGQGLQYMKPGTIDFAKALIAASDNHSVNLSSITYGEQVGVAYNLKNLVSFSAAIRFLEGNQTMSLKSNYIVVGNGGNEISYSATAFGLGGVFGVHVKPFDGFDVSAQYQTICKLEYEINDVTGNLAPSFGIKKGATFNTDLPSVLNIGVGYQIIKPLYMSASFNYYFNENAHQDTILGKTDYNNSWEATIGADYDFSKEVTASLGISYAKQGTTDTSNSTFNPVLDSLSVGGGAEIKPIENLAVTVGLMYVKYFDKDYEIGEFKTELSKKIFMFSLGATYKLPL